MAKHSKATTRNAARAAMEVAAAGASTFSDSFLSSLSFRVRQETDALMRTVEERALLMRDRLVNGIYFAILLGVGSVFIIAALLLYLVQAGLSWATAFLIGGAALLLGALIFQYARPRR